MNRGPAGIGAGRPMSRELQPTVVHVLAKHPEVAGVFSLAESLDMDARWSA